MATPRATAFCDCFFRNQNLVLVFYFYFLGAGVFMFGYPLYSWTGAVLVLDGGRYFGLFVRFSD